MVIWRERVEFDGAIRWKLGSKYERVSVGVGWRYFPGECWQLGLTRLAGLSKSG